MPRGDWTRVESLPHGLPTKVRLHAVDPATDSTKIRGLFASAASTSITLMLRDGRTRTIVRSDIRKVTVRRKFARRYAGWIVAGLTIAATWFLAIGEEPPYPPLYLSGTGLSGLAFWRQRWRDFYRSSAVPRN